MHAPRLPAPPSAVTPRAVGCSPEPEVTFRSRRPALPQGPGTCGHHCLIASPCSWGSSSTETRGPQHACTSLWCGPAAGSLLFHPPSRGALALRPQQTHLDSSDGVSETSASRKRRRQQPFCNHSDCLQPQGLSPLGPGFKDIQVSSGALRALWSRWRQDEGGAEAPGEQED